MIRSQRTRRFHWSPGDVSVISPVTVINSSMVEKKYNPAEPRDSHGEWVPNNGGVTHLWHGTGHEFHIGDIIEPGHPGPWGTSDRKGVSVTASYRDANSYSLTAEQYNREYLGMNDAKARVYEVEPIADDMHDGATPNEYVSHTGFRVLDEGRDGLPPGLFDQVYPHGEPRNPQLKARLPEVVKVGPEGYIHGWICVRPPCGQYEQVTYDKKKGAVFHQGQRIGRVPSKDADGKYSAIHIAHADDGSEVRTKLPARFDTPQQAFAAIPAYHDVKLLEDHSPSGPVKDQVTGARAKLAAGATGAAAAQLREAARAARTVGNESLATHIDHVRAELADEPGVEPKSAASDTRATPAPDVKPVNEIITRMAHDPSYVPSADDIRQLQEATDQMERDWDSREYYDDKRWELGARLRDLNSALDQARERHQLAEETAAAEAARGKALDISAFSGKLSDHLPPAEYAELKDLISDSHLSYPDPKDEPWGTHGSPGYERAYRLERLKYTAAQHMMEQAGVPHEAAYAIAGSPDQETGDRQVDDDGEFMNMEHRVNAWSVAGAYAKEISADYDKARSMTQPPEIRPGDFTYQKVTRTIDYGGKREPYHYDVLAFTDQSHEAQQRREAAGIYWGIRAQKYYTQQVLAELPKHAQLGDSVPVTRLVFGDQAAALRDAERNGKPWVAATRMLSSWAEPSARAKKSVVRFITRTMGEAHPVWLSQSISPDQIFMHWRGEGVLRNGVKVLGEVVVADSNAESTRTRMSEIGESA